MACNFRILTHQNSDDIHLKLTGDFDGSSACELINALKTCSVKTNKVFIHTGGLKDVHNFGKGVFQSNFPEIAHQAGELIFTGKKLEFRY